MYTYIYIYICTHILFLFIDIYIYIHTYMADDVCCIMIWRITPQIAYPMHLTGLWLWFLTIICFTILQIILTQSTVCIYMYLYVSIWVWVNHYQIIIDTYYHHWHLLTLITAQKCLGAPRNLSSLTKQQKKHLPSPRCSKYEIYTYIWAIFGVHVCKSSIHGASGSGYLFNIGIPYANKMVLEYESQHLPLDKITKNHLGKLIWVNHI